jgi:hypothetical protein
MHRRVMAKLSFANVISVVALFVALSGAAYAGGLVTGKTIENGTITGRDIAKNSITGAQVKEDKLRGVDTCEAETPIDYRDICFGSPQPATTWAAALTACQSVALRLPSTGEALQITGAAQHKNNAYIWTSDYADGGPPGPSPFARLRIRSSRPRT